MRNYNIKLMVGVLLGGGFAAALMADDIVLTGGARLTGTIRSINDAGVVEVTSNLAPEPVWLNMTAVEKVEFSSNNTAPIIPPALVELSNGDLLPATIEAFDGQHLTVASPEAGRLEIPRNALKSLQLGNHQHKLIYAGPRSLDEWTSGEGEVKNWTFEHNSLVANGPGTLTKNLALPAQFSLRFVLKWQAKAQPNFQIYFADPLTSKGDRCDRYYLQFGAAGMEIKREAATGKHFSTIVQLNRNPNQYPDHQVVIELQVNRKDARLRLLLNDEPEGEYLDPIPAVPTGTGLTLVSNTPTGIPQEIRDIKILELDAAPDSHHTADRGDLKTDSLLSREDDRWGGHLLAINQINDGRLFRFQSNAPNELLEIPEAAVASVFFAAAKRPPTAPGDQTLLLRLRGNGTLRVTSCLFKDDTVVVSHQLLGPLTLRRDAILAMNRAATPTKTATKP